MIEINNIIREICKEQNRHLPKDPVSAYDVYMCAMT